MKKIICLVLVLFLGYGGIFIMAADTNSNTVELSRYEEGFSGRVTPASNDDTVIATMTNHESYDGDAYIEAQYIVDNRPNGTHCTASEVLDYQDDVVSCTKVDSAAVNDNPVETMGQYNQISTTSSLETTLKIETK